MRLYCTWVTLRVTQSRHPSLSACHFAVSYNTIILSPLIRHSIAVDASTGIKLAWELHAEYPTLLTIGAGLLHTQRNVRGPLVRYKLTAALAISFAYSRSPASGPA